MYVTFASYILLANSHDEFAANLMKKPLLLILLLLMAGFSIYFIFLGKVIIGVSLLLLSGWLDFAAMRAHRNISK